MRYILATILRKVVGYKARGFRDVHWCWSLNEPFIVEYKHYEGKSKRYCPNCNMEDFDDWNHPFIITIYKPRWHKSYQGFKSWLEELI